jgi:hypothetical protein
MPFPQRDMMAQIMHQVDEAGLERGFQCAWPWNIDD